MQENRIVGDVVLLNDAKILFEDNTFGNTLFVPKGEQLRLNNCVIRFYGNNSLVFIRENSVSVNVSVFNNNTFYMGKGSYINNSLNVIVSEQTCVFIGDDLLCSFGVHIRTADPHLLYDCATHSRINPSKSVFIGDHVWIGQDSLILKGARIGSGAVIGAKALVSNKILDSNSAYAGVPVKKIRDGVFWTGSCVHSYTNEQTQKSEYYPSDDYVFNGESGSLYPKLLMEGLTDGKTVEDRIAFLQEMDSGKDRFYLRNGRDNRKNKG